MILNNLFVVCMVLLEVGKAPALLYAQEYCSYLPNVLFCHNTIVFTAMTGVTTTLICGESMHGALFLNQKHEIEPEQIEL